VSREQIENILWKVLTGDKLRAMKLPARLLLAALTLSVGALSPIVPAEVSLPNSHASNCCVSQNADRCHSCLTTMGDTTSALASSCCAAQSGCCALYFTRSTPFSTSMQLLGVIGINDEGATTRTQRPLVPPPRGAFS
jgi:hypothetical protein